MASFIMSVFGTANRSTAFPPVALGEQAAKLKEAWTSLSGVPELRACIIAVKDDKEDPAAQVLQAYLPMLQEALACGGPVVEAFPTYIQVRASEVAVPACQAVLDCFDINADTWMVPTGRPPFQDLVQRVFGNPGRKYLPGAIKTLEDINKAAKALHEKLLSLDFAGVINQIDLALNKGQRYSQMQMALGNTAFKTQSGDYSQSQIVQDAKICIKGCVELGLWLDPPPESGKLAVPHELRVELCTAAGLPADSAEREPAL